ncbi:MAG: PEP-CTERM sorting domain-containing protein, partial [Aeoliella sp.]
GYFNENFIFGDQSGDIDDNGRLDFDDIDPFAALIPGMTSAQVLAAINGMPSAVPEPGTCLLLGGGVLLILTATKKQNLFDI